MGNWVVVCHGGVDPDRESVQVPQGTELQFWVNEGQPAPVAMAQTIVAELRRNPGDIDTLQALIDRTWGPTVHWHATSGVAGQSVQALLLHGDPAIACVGVLNLTTRDFTRWNTRDLLTLQQLLRTYTGNVHLICCR